MVVTELKKRGVIVVRQCVEVLEMVALVGERVRQMRASGSCESVEDALVAMEVAEMAGEEMKEALQDCCNHLNISHKEVDAIY